MAIPNAKRAKDLLEQALRRKYFDLLAKLENTIDEALAQDRNSAFLLLHAGDNYPLVVVKAAIAKLDNLGYKTELRGDSRDGTHTLSFEWEPVDLERLRFD